ncbi:MAG: hypothetical protein KDC79_15540 [Cyclobacteriaceae bacterium]|nr:hypothetical protein [Cyclobacteriaceae bacterium]
MKKLFLTFFTVLFIFSAQRVLAQGCDAPSSEEGVTVFGYVQPEFDMNFYEDTEAAFRFRRMRIGVMGNIPYDFSYYVMLETSPFLNPNQPGPFLLDAFVSYTRFNYLKVSVGSFKYRFGRELSMPCHSLYTIRRSKVVDELTGGIGGGNRDIGIMLLGGGKEDLINYYVSLTNGYGVLNVTDNNLFDGYNLTGRVTIQPIKGLSFGASARYSENPPAATDVTDNDTKMRWGFDAEYSFKNFTIFGEYIDGKDEGSYTEGGGCDGNPVTKTGVQNADGFFAMAVYRYNKFEPVYKLETYNTSKGEVGSDVTTDANSLCHTFGLNIYPNDWTRIQMNYIYATEDPAEIKNDALMIQLQVKF